MWQLFTENARRVILLGQQEAEQMKSGYVGTEHLLLGLLRLNDEDAATQILQNIGISLPAVRAEIGEQLQLGASEASAGEGEPKLTPKAKRVLELGADEGRRMRHNYIGTEHLLVALTREKDGLAATVLRRLGLDWDEARAQVRHHLDSNSSAETAQDPASMSPDSPVGVSPEAQIERVLGQFVHNLNYGAALRNQSLIFGARLGWFGAQEWAGGWNRRLPERQIQLQSLAIDLIDNGKAQVVVRYQIESPNPEPERMPLAVREWQARIWTETVAFATGIDPNERTGWQIVPDAQFPTPDYEVTLAFLGQAAFALSQKGYEATLKFPASRALNHLSHLSSALAMIAADFGTVAFAPQYLRPALTPYLIQLEGQKEVFLDPDEVFHVPDRQEHWGFNFHLCERSLDELSQAELTVAFYDGAEGNFVFRYDGQTAVAFADGHGALVSPDEAKRLIWEID